MSSNRNKLVSAAINRAYILIDYDKNEEEQYESIKQIILTDESLTNNEKLGAINIISGYSEIYTADWIDGRYEEWDSKEKQLKRVCAHVVVLKKLENIENTNRN
uniref:Uncharacterized protein n=1 Tax=Rhizophagus irregularis (strain DAOM 181602 / DAOM 197198 / MUCL 43194) TaxID=747089 RepID=U9UUT4_RHIID